MFAFLAGSKSYIVAAIGAVVTVIYMLDFMRQDTWLGIMGLLMAGGTATVRAGVAKVEAQVEHVQTVALVQAAAVDAKLSRVEQKVVQGPPVIIMDATPAPSHIIVP